MARARNIKPSFFTNDILAELDPLDRLAFIGLWTIADYKGCIEYRANKIKAMILPYDNCDFEKIAINLDKSGFIRMYSVQGIDYIKIINFEKHQNPHKNEREKGSDIPDYNSQVVDSKMNSKESGKIAINPDKNGTARADSCFLKPETLPAENKFSDDDLKLAEFIWQRILLLNPNAKKPNLEKWADVIRVTRQQDKRTHKELQDVFIWANSDSFWQSNILSPTKLREQFDKLVIKINTGMQNEKNQSNNKEYVDNSAAGRVRAEVAKLKSSRECMADDVIDVRAQVGIELRGES